MAGHVDIVPPFLPKKGIRFSASSAHIQTSPHKFENISNYDTRKHGASLKPNAAIDRPLLGVSSMGHTILVDFHTFEKDVLKIQSGLESITHLSQDLVAHATRSFDRLFKAGASPIEEAIGETFIDVVNTEDHGGLLKGHRAAFTGNKASHDGCTAKVDAGVYPQEHTPAAGNPDWTHIRLIIEFKRRGTSYDPFDDDDPNAPEAHARSRTAVRNQILDYARVVHEYQHRVCIYGLFVIGPEFRLMRFDHSGLIVTKKENYAQNPKLLLSFLAWFDSLSAEDQGLDPTAMLLSRGSRAYQLMDEFAKENQSDMSHNEGDKVDANPPRPDTSTAPPKSDGPARNTRQQTKAAAVISQLDESYLDALELVDEDPRVFKYVRDQFRESLDDDWPRYKLEVGQGKEKRIFLVGKPVWTAFWLFGRGTRGYVALDVNTRRFTFLKDCWRPFYEGVDPEGHYLELLNEEAAKDRRVRVPAVIAHGDVADQVTFTARYAQHRVAEAKKLIRARRDIPTSTPSSSGGRSGKRARDVNVHSVADTGGDDEDQMEYRVYTHYRIVFKDVCLPFTAIRSSQQLVRGLFHCITTYTKLRLLHRDISAGNVIIRPALSSNVDENGQRTVTWNGILTDWELAKFVPKPDAAGKRKEAPRQPERTGTWQFMSVAYIRNHPSQPVAVADELESFFHVLLFYAVRLLCHNVPDVRLYVTEYFDSFTVAEGARRDCSHLKSTAMAAGAIRLSGGVQLAFHVLADSSEAKLDEGTKIEVDESAKDTNDDALDDSSVDAINGLSKADGNDPTKTDVDVSPKVKIAHPYLNKLFQSLLNYFKARYAILEWEQQQLGALPSFNDTSSINPSTTDDEDAPPPRTVNRVTNSEPMSRRPSEEDWDLARALDDHTGVLNDFWEAIGHANWPKDDVVEDRLPDNYDPRELMLALERMCAPSFIRTTGMNVNEEDLKDAPARKKRRTDASEPTALSTTMPPPPGRIVGTSFGDSIIAGMTVKGKGKGKGRSKAGSLN
ncbi:hypothetical protein PYCCODRAFT_1467912 [Trametes coccinea BRFM310]|uniref:Fungal-type protein kinase domain-containing protein n=1 Tax=Trametes coccinea (strain BRFM310) TaxID=1353009 RepID=A0A1Y2IMB1_TRAC3|nr:hypothetical protein PYCCODRAFT_1467912 [Trametes coccinea BRFM310]